MNHQNDRKISIKKISWSLAVFLIILSCCSLYAEESLDEEAAEQLNVPDSSLFSDSIPDQMGFQPDVSTTPTPVPTSSVVKNPTDRTSNFNPTPRISVGYITSPGARSQPNSVYAEQGLELNGTPISRTLNILNGPFIIDYTIHPKISDPTYGWMTIKVSDAWENLVADGGYNRNYPSSTTQHLTIYRTGLYNMAIDGNFASVDFVLRTMDPTPSMTPTPTPVPDEEEDEFYE